MVSELIFQPHAEGKVVFILYTEYYVSSDISALLVCNHNGALVSRFVLV